MKIAFIVVINVLLVACSSTGGNKANLGAVAGGIAGAAACSGVGDGMGKIGAMIGCGLIGVWIGGKIGSYMDEEDKKFLNQVLEKEPSYKKITRSNPRTGYNFDITPLPVSTNSTGGVCRDYLAEIAVNGQLINEKHRSCRQPDGSWIEG